MAENDSVIDICFKYFIKIKNQNFILPLFPLLQFSQTHFFSLQKLKAEFIIILQVLRVLDR